MCVCAPPQPHPHSHTPPPPAGSEDTVVCRSNCYYCREDKSGPPACCGGSALTSHFHRQTNTFPRTVKFSRRRRRRGRHQGAPATRNPAPLFSQISSKSFGRSFVALFSSSVVPFFNLFQFPSVSFFQTVGGFACFCIRRDSLAGRRVGVFLLFYLIDTMPTTVA